MDIANVFNNGMTNIPTGLPTQAYTYAAIARKGAWEQVQGEKENRLIVRYQFSNPSGLTVVQFIADVKDLSQWEEVEANLWKQTTELSDLDADVYQAMLIQLLNGPKDKDGNTIITSRQILKYRGILPRREKASSGAVYSAGYRSEDIDVIEECIRRMEKVVITVYEMDIIDDASKSQRGRKTKRSFTHTSKLFMFGDKVTHTIKPLDGDGPVVTVEVAWQYRQSSWMLPFLEGSNRFTGLFLQKILNYDPYHQQWEKRLARHLMYWLRMNASRNPKPAITIGELMQKLNLDIQERYPQRTRDHFEKAMNTIAGDGLLAWKYKEEKQLVPRKWLGTWLDQEILVEDPPEIKNQYAIIASHAKAIREQNHTTAPKKPNKKEATTKKKVG